LLKLKLEMIQNHNSFINLYVDYIQYAQREIYLILINQYNYHRLNQKIQI
jgi:hypothetical protein